MDKATGKAARLYKAIFEREPEMVTRDCVIFIAFSHMVALIYMWLKVTKDAICGTD